MRVLLELTQEEGEILFDSVKGFAFDRIKTVVVSMPKNNSDEGAVIADNVKTASEEVLASREDKTEVTLEIVRAVRYRH